MIFLNCSDSMIFFNCSDSMIFWNCSDSMIFWNGSDSMIFWNCYDSMIFWNCSDSMIFWNCSDSIVFCSVLFMHEFLRVSGLPLSTIFPLVYGTVPTYFVFHFSKLTIIKLRFSSNIHSNCILFKSFGFLAPINCLNCLVI